MKRQIIGLLMGIAVLAVSSSVEVKAVDYQTALALQAAATAEYNRQLAEQAAAAQAQQKALEAAIAAQQKAAADAMKAAQDAQAAQAQAAAKAAAQAADAAAAIQAANAVVPQLDTICDTNCAEQNAMLYAKTINDFVLVDISEQRAIFYKNGVRILGDNCVTGNASRKHNTSVGVHQIILKDNDRTLHGSYGEAFVKYWMRFTKDGQGLHDAGWRKTFGSDIYITNGSHGCVNLPRETAQIIFDNCYVGMFVIVEN